MDWACPGGGAGKVGDFGVHGLIVRQGRGIMSKGRELIWGRCEGNCSCVGSSSPKLHAKERRPLLGDPGSLRMMDDGCLMWELRM